MEVARVGVVETAGGAVVSGAAGSVMTVDSGSPPLPQAMSTPAATRIAAIRFVRFMTPPGSPCPTCRLTLLPGPRQQSCQACSSMKATISSLRRPVGLAVVCSLPPTPAASAHPKPRRASQAG